MRRVLRDPIVGSLLIQSDDKSGETILLHSMLPISIRERHRAEVTRVFLLDAQVCPTSTLRVGLLLTRNHEYR
jgi:uridine kinase